VWPRSNQHAAQIRAAWLVVSDRHTATHLRAKRIHPICLLALRLWQPGIAQR
jgi:hypothetical protein